MAGSVHGLAGVLKALQAAGRDMERAVAGSMYAEGQAIMAESVRQVPVDTGRLRASAYVSSPRDGASGPEVTLGYGTSYALPVHERTEIPHKVGKAKYLEDPMNAARAGYADRVGARARRMWARGEGYASVGGFGG